MGQLSNMEQVMQTTTETNAEIARRFVEEVLAKGNMAVFEELVADEIVVHSGIRPFGPMVGKAAFREGLGALAAFSNGSMTIEDVLAVDDRVVVRYRAVADHTGDQLGVPATGKRIMMWEIRLMRLRDGQIVEDFVADINYDWPWLVAPAYPDGIGRTGLV